MSRPRDKTPREVEFDATVLTPSTVSMVAAEPSPVRLHALVISDKIVATYPLPDSGEVHIGRGPHCEIPIDDPSISRTHAALTIGPPLAIRDLNSANGTRVRDQRIGQHSLPIAPGEPIQIGGATLIVQRQVAQIRPRRMWTHDYFEVRLEEECDRAARTGSTFALMRLACASDASVEAVQHVIADLVRVSDVVGEYGPSDYEVLLVDNAPDEVELTVRRFAEELKSHGISVRIGIACFPRDGRNANELMARAEANTRGHAKGSRARADIVAERTMQDLYALAARVATGTITVLILGETGVGKEVLAEHVHKSSPRAGKPYLRLNCAALSESLLESELFGHERGAFTGAVGTKEGLLETADGGSVFLDEVGELPLAIQVKLLRVIEERVVLRVGGLKPRPLDVRFVAATHRDLEAEIARGTFRQDLYFRLNGATLVIPPLRERSGEIPALAQAFLAQAARQAGLAHVPKLGSETLDCLASYSWPGNIRELRNMIERAVLLCGDGDIQPRHLPLEKMRVTISTSAAPMAALIRPRDLAEHQPLTNPAVLRRGPKLSVEDERAEIEAALQACGGNQTRAAKMLGIGRRTLINRVKEFGLARPRSK
jgi:two-component system response regulator AtoC